jgi:hypothetical protein
MSERKILEDHFDVEFERRLAELADQPYRESLAAALQKTAKVNPSDR